MSEETVNGRATVGQVYEIVGRVEGKLDALNIRLDSLNVANEHRFTELETKAARWEATEEDVKALKTAHAVAQSHLKVGAGVVGVFVTLMAGVLGLALAHAFHW